MLHFIIFIIVGMIAGTLSGLLGIGGGSILVPTFLLGLSPQIDKQYLGHIAIATSTAVIFFTSVVSSFSHFKHGSINSKLLLYMSLGAIIGAFLTGEFIFTKISSHNVNIIFIIFLIYTAITTILPSKKTVNTKNLKINYKLVTFMGGIIASISSIVGVGGGFLTVPFLLYLGLPIHNAIATSAGLGVTIAMSATLTYAFQSIPVEKTIGLIYYPAVIMMIPLSMLMAIYGAKLAHKCDANKLKRIYGYFLIVLIVLLSVKTIKYYF